MLLQFFEAFFLIYAHFYNMLLDDLQCAPSKKTFFPFCMYFRLLVRECDFGRLCDVAFLEDWVYSGGQ